MKTRPPSNPSDDYLQFLEFTPVPLFIEVDGKFAAINQPALEFFGATDRADMVGKPILDFVHPDSRPLVEARLRDVHSGKHNPLIEEKLLRLDGQAVDAEVGSIPFVFQGRNGAQVFVRDIVRRKQAEEAARQSDERYRMLFEGAPLGISVSRGEKLIYVNSAYLKMFGYRDLSEIRGQSMMETVAPHRREITQERIEQRRRGAVVSSDYENIGLRKDGSEFPFQVNISRMQLADGWATVAFIADITERKKTEENLEQSVSLISATLESTADGILVVDRNGNIVSFNQKFAQMWRIPNLILATKDDRRAMEFTLSQLKDPQTFVKKVEALYEQPEAESYDLVEFKDGRVFERYSQPQCIRGKSVGRVWSFRDITARKRDEQRTSSLLVLGQLLNSVSTPMQAARLILEISDELFGWDACSLDLYSAEKGLVYPTVIFDTIDGKKVDVTSTYAAGAPSAKARRVMEKGAELILRQPPFAFSAESKPFGDVHRPSASLMNVPIRNAQKIIGILSIQSYSPNAYEQDDLAALQSLADHCGGAFDRIANRQALHESEELFRTLSESSPLGIFKNDAEGRLIYVNERWTAISGLSLEESVEFGWAKVLHPADRDAFWEKRTEGMAAGTGWASEHRLITPQKKVRWVRVLATPIAATEGRPGGYVGTIEDITERKRGDIATAALSKLGQSLSSATSPTEAARVIMAVADELLGWDSCFLEINSTDDDKVHRILNMDVVNGQRQEVPPADLKQGRHPMWRKMLEKGPQLVLRGEPLTMTTGARAFGDLSRPSASLLFIPIRHSDQVVGFLSIQSYTPNAYDEKDLATMQTLADHCGAALARLRAQEALLKSESQLRLVWENSLEAMRLINEQGVILSVNDAYCQLVGKPKEALLGKFFPIVYDVSLESMMTSKHQEYFPSRTTPAHQEEELTLWNGKKIFLEMSNSYLEVPGQPTLLLSVFRDITERKQLEKRNAAFSRLAQNLSVMCTPADASRIIRDVSNELFRWDVCTVELYSAEQNLVFPILYIDTIEGKRVEIPPSATHRQLSDRARRVVQSGAELILKKPPFTPSPDALPMGGMRGSASIMIVPIRNGVQVVGILSLQSYTPDAFDHEQLSLLQSIADQCGGALDRIRTEEAFKGSEARFHSVWENSADGMRLTDAEGIIVGANRAYCKMVGMEQHDLEGHPFTVVLAAHANRAESLQRYKERFQRNAIEKFIVRRLTFASGKTVDLEGANSFVQLPGQKPLLLAIFRDVTEKTRLEEQLRQSQKMDSVGQLAGGIAHDFNNLLTIIQGHTSLLLQTSEISADTSDSLQQISAAAERSANLTRQLLTFSRRQVIQPKNLDLNEVVNNMTKMLRRILGEDIFLLVLQSPGLPLVFADQGMVEQLLMNLAINSRDAMPKGGELVINTSLVTIGELDAKEHTEAYPGQFISITIKDSGCGIPPEILPRIFEPFFTTKEIGKGTGLGLATAYGIVKQHQGWIRVTSTVGQGTAFRIFLPISKDQSLTSEEAAKKIIPRGTETILIVEDEAPLRQLVQFILERQGYKILSAETGILALEVWHEHKDKIDLLLTDLVMPDGMSGRDLVEKIHLEKPALKVVYTSGYNTEIIGKDFILEEGINFLQKPYHPHKLAQTIRDCLDGKRN